MEFDLLHYSDTKLQVCTRGWTRRQLHDLIRQVLNSPDRIVVCSCLEDAWIRETLDILGVQWNNEPSHG